MELIFPLLLILTGLTYKLVNKRTKAVSSVFDYSQRFKDLNTFYDQPEVGSDFWNQEFDERVLWYGLPSQPWERPVRIQEQEYQEQVVQQLEEESNLRRLEASAQPLRLKGTEQI